MPSAPPAPPPTWREVLRRPSFRVALLRQSLPVLGVFVLGWPALDVVLFFLLDVWLYLTVRAGCEITYDPRYGSPDTGLKTLVANTLTAAIALGLLVGMAGFLTLGFALAGADVGGFVAGVRHPVFFVSLVLLVSSHAWEGVRFVERVRARTVEERNQDTLAIRVMTARLVVVAAAPLVISFVGALGIGGHVLVLLISGAILWLEAFPERANRILGYHPGLEYQ